MKYAGQPLRLAYWMDSCSRSWGIENINQTFNRVVWQGKHKSNLKRENTGHGIRPYKSKFQIVLRRRPSNFSKDIIPQLGMEGMKTSVPTMARHRVTSSRGCNLGNAGIYWGIIEY